MGPIKQWNRKTEEFELLMNMKHSNSVYCVVFPDPFHFLIDFYSYTKKTICLITKSNDVIMEFLTRDELILMHSLTQAKIAEFSPSYSTVLWDLTKEKF